MEHFLCILKSYYNITEPLVFICTNLGYVQYKSADHVLYSTASLMDKMFLVSNRNMFIGLLACLKHSIAAIEKNYNMYYPRTWLQTHSSDDEHYGDMP